MIISTILTHHVAADFLFNPFDPVGTINLPSPIFWQAFHCANFPLRRLLVMRPLNLTPVQKAIQISDI